VNIVKGAPIDSFDTGPALHFSKQIKLHPIKYLNGLADSFIKRGGQIFTHTHAQEIKGGEKAFVKTRDGTFIRAKSIVVATNTPINDLFAVHTKQAAYRTYVIAAKIPKGLLADALYWDTLDPYHYFRTDSLTKTDPDFETHEMLVVGGEDHKTGQNDHPDESFTRLEKWTKSRFPAVGEILYTWSGHGASGWACLSRTQSNG
jgi:glycine/D-amino acid oxidase-like deaminating enzyme